MVFRQLCRFLLLLCLFLLLALLVDFILLFVFLSPFLFLFLSLFLSLFPFLFLFLVVFLVVFVIALGVLVAFLAELHLDVLPGPLPLALSPFFLTRPQSREQIYSSWLPRTVLRAAMGKNLTSIPGTSGPSHPLQSTIQPILGVLEQMWPKNPAEQANPTASPGVPAVLADLNR